jgi:hypothetical protein
MRVSRREAIGIGLGAAASLAAGEGSGFIRAQGKNLVGPNGEILRLRGINLGNWLEPEGYMFLLDKGPQSPREIEDFICELIGPEEAVDFWTEYRKRYITPADIDFIRRCGFNSVRIPLHWKFFTEGGRGYEILQPVIEACRSNRIWVILDMHCAPGGQTGSNIDDSYGYPWLYESESSQHKLIEIWSRIAEHYRDEQIVLGYDLLNEPIPHFPRLQIYNSRLERLYKRVTRAIRQVDQNHTVILEAAQWDTNFKVFGPPFDPNSLYEFHKYWMKPDQASIQEYVDFRDRYDVPIWLGESGENTDNWITQFRTLLDQNDIGWCFWPYKKMVKTSCVVSVTEPGGWSDVVRLGQIPIGTGQAEKEIAQRPTVERSREITRDLLERVPLQRCQVNAGYLQALGLQVPSV